MSGVVSGNPIWRLALLLAFSALLAWLILHRPSDDSDALVTTPAIAPLPELQASRPSPLPVPVPGRVFDITVASEQELEAVLKRAEVLLTLPSVQQEKSRIALVLHGAEVGMFAIANYEKNRAIVDLAAKLDAFQLVDIKMCRTRMRMEGLEEKDIPAFIELVPFGPDEVRRLERNGFLRM